MSKHKKTGYIRKEKMLAYNPEKPNRQARRLGIVAASPKSEEVPRKSPPTAVLNESASRARQYMEKIVPPGMTYSSYMEYLKEKRRQLEERKTSV